MGVLAVLGLDELQQQLYTRLATTSSATTDELAQDTGEGKRGVAAALEALRERGLVELLVGAPERWAATPPEPALDALVYEQQQALARVRAHAQSLAEQARAHASRQRPDEMLAIVEGQRNLHAHFEQLQRMAEHEVLVFDRPPYPYTAGTEPNPLEQERQAAGVVYRTVYDLEVLHRPDTFARVQADLASGEQARVLAGVPLKLAIADRSMALLPLMGDTDSTSTAAVVVRPSVLLDSLVALFESLWERAVPLLPGSSTGPTVDPELVQVVQLMATGMSDLRIARILGASERTTRRKVAAAMEALGATSRFQAGILAQRQGWLADE